MRTTVPSTTRAPPREPELLQLPRRQRDAGRHRHWPRGRRPRSRSTRGRGRCGPGSGHHRRAPVVEVLDAADLHAGRVDVDPVVREQVLRGRGSAPRRGSRGSAARPPPAATRRRRAGSPGAHTSARSGTVEMTWSASKRRVAHPAFARHIARTRPSAQLETRDLGARMRTRPPIARIPGRDRPPTSDPGRAADTGTRGSAS